MEARCPLSLEHVAPIPTHISLSLSLSLMRIILAPVTGARYPHFPICTSFPYSLARPGFLRRGGWTRARSLPPPRPTSLFLLPIFASFPCLLLFPSLVSYTSLWKVRWRCWYGILTKGNGNVNIIHWQIRFYLLQWNVSKQVALLVKKTHN